MGRYHAGMMLSELERKVCDVIVQQGEAMRDDLAAHVAIPTGRNYQPGLDQYRALLVERLTALDATAQYIEGQPRPAWLTLPCAGSTAATAATTTAAPSSSSSSPSSSASTPPPTVLVRHRAKRVTQRILLAGHIDTVHDPHGPFRELSIAPDGRTATGPGVVDMKGGILIAVVALEALAACGVDLNWTFLLNSDEETGSFHSFQALRTAAQEHDVGFALEPALPDGSLAIERMGAGQFKIEVFGRSAHVGREFTRGVSAVTKLGEVLTALGQMAQPQRGMIVNVGPLQGGGVTNVVADYAACWGNVRFVNEDAANELARQIDALATSEDAMPRVVVHRLYNRPAKPLIEPVKKLAETARQVAEDLGQRLPFSSTGGVCDGNILQDAGLPTLDTLGVRGGNLHRLDEFIDMTSLVERAQLLAVLLMRVADAPIPQRV